MYFHISQKQSDYEQNWYCIAVKWIACNDKYNYLIDGFNTNYIQPQKLVLRKSTCQAMQSLKILGILEKQIF